MVKAAEFLEAWTERCRAMTWRGVISLSARRKPVCYTIHIRQGWEGELAVEVEGVADDQRSRDAVADALRRAADLIEHEPITSNEDK